MLAAFTAGQKLTAAGLNLAINSLVARKTADETVNNNATLQNDNHLLWTVEANAVYVLDLHLTYQTGATPDIKLAWTFPVGLTMNWGGVGADVGFVVVVFGALIQTTVGVLGGNGANVHVIIDGLVTVGGTAGTLQLQWAQNTANASDTIVRAGSYGLLTRIG